VEVLWMSHELKIPSLIPVLAVERVEEAVAFYEELGFSEIFSISDVSGTVVHAHLRKDDSVLFLGRLGASHYEGHERAVTIEESRINQRGIGITLMLQVDDLAAVYKLVRSKELQILAEPADEYYGDRVFFFLDPFGYEWKISQPIPTG
jgi:PhnB protein